MKKIYKFLYFFAMYWGVRAFSLVEITDIICSIPEKYSFRFTECVIDESPAVIEKLSDAIYQCVEKYYETKGRADSLLSIACHHIDLDINIIDCLTSKRINFDERGERYLPNEQEFKEYRNAIEHCSVTAFTHSEKLTIFCSIPEKYLLRFINCTVQKSPEFYQKASDLLYECMDQFYENNGKLDCLLQFMCYESGKDINVHRCFIEKIIEELGRPSEEDRNQFDDAIRYCTSYA